MFILKILMKLVLFPLVLILFFLRIWVELLYKIGEVAFGLFCIVMLVIFAVNVWVMFKWQMWEPLVIDIGIAFVIYLGTLGTTGIVMAFQALTDKLMELLES
ncbi:hypothetical protein [Butyrivibrio sp. INlla16]|uniref:hypothetical protein n=1 Tax=Butyrivibrio sp. INlla16 TaxID=1520807 RepID=UPI00088FA1B2|nr:hypothetical protein [Butyrivibrio sp. INlla16]SDB64567.1 hypothetical protein SAMN02910263_03613 [Butyrivibrio sp. INlla16]